MTNHGNAYYVQSKELIMQKQMSDAEVAALEYLNILENYYPLQSYDQAHEHHSNQKKRDSRYISKEIQKL